MLRLRIVFIVFRSVAGDQHHSADRKPIPQGIGAAPTPVIAIQCASEDYDEDQSEHIVLTYDRWLNLTMALQGHVTSNRQSHFSSQRGEYKAKLLVCPGDG